MVLLLGFVALGAFGLTYLTPGDAAVTVAGEGATPERIEEVRATLGLDRPLVEQFGSWASSALRGELGESLVNRIDVTSLIGARFGATMSLVISGLFVAVVVGVPAGLLAGSRPGTLVDRAVTALTSLGIALPAFWLASLLLIVFSIDRGWFPAIGYTALNDDPADWLRHMVLPGLAIGAASAAEVARQTRASVADVVGQDYIRTSRSLGLRPRSIFGKHVLKNAAIPIATVCGLQVGRILAAGVVVEQMFAIPGLGQLAIGAVRTRDLPTIQGIVVVTALFVLMTNLLVDLSYAWLNPRLRHQ